jgi:protein O-GlcNAc transferase
MMDVGAKVMRARTLLQQGKAQQALPDLQRALSQSPANPDLNSAMGMVMMSLGRPEQALHYAQRALAARPQDPMLLTNVGMWLGALERPEEAAPFFERALSGDPGMVEAMHGMANVMRLRNNSTGALEYLEPALRARPSDANLAATYVALLKNVGRVPEAVAFCRAWLAERLDARVAGAYAHAITFLPGAAPEEVFEAATLHGRLLEASAPARQGSYPNSRDPERPIRLGLLSYELRRHAVAKYLGVLLEHYDRGALEVYCYSTSKREDAVSERLKARASVWRNVAGLGDQALAERIRADRIDALLETSGITHGNRLRVMAMRPAPVSISYVGYANTTGLSAIDWRLVDVNTDPPGAEAWSSERLYRLDPTYYCYEPPADGPEPGEPPCLVSGAVTFGSFNSSFKVNGVVLALWARILGQVPGSRLMIKGFEYEDAGLRSTMVSELGALGVAPERITVEGPTHDEAGFLAQYRRVDIGLDPFPYNGMATTMDALWMGVPVVTLEGRMHAGRGSTSILRTLGEPGLIAADEDGYVAIAAGLAADRARLSDFRANLRGRMLASALCDGPGTARRLERAIRVMWREWCGGKAP